MNIVSNILHQFTTPFYRSMNQPSALSLRIMMIAGSILLGLGMAKREVSPEMYEGGVQVPMPKFDSLVFLEQKCGPFFSPELSCHLQKSISTGEKCLTQIESYETAISPIKPKEMRSYVNAVKGLVPVRDKNVGQFPINFEAFLFNGFGFVGNGNQGCNITKLEDYLLCEKALKIFEREMLSETPEYVEMVEESIYSQGAFRNKGCKLGLQKEYILAQERDLYSQNIGDLFDRSNEEILYFNKGINPIRLANYRQALQLVAIEFLQDDCFFNKSVEEVIDFIKRTHKALTINLLSEDENSDHLMRSGEYRTKEMYVLRTATNEFSLDHMIDALVQKGASYEQVRIFIRDMQEFDKEKKRKAKALGISEKDVIPFQNIFTKEGLDIANKIMFLPILSTEVPSQMEAFVTKLKNYAQQDLHPIALAAWTLKEVGRIHPFNDGNGRVGRLLANALLIRGGYEPVIFHDDDAYQEALEKDDEKPGAFAAYLAKLIKEQSTGVQILEQVPHP